MGGLVGILLAFVHGETHGAKVSNATVDPGGGANHTCEHFAPPGDDSSPLPDDYVALLSRPRADGYTAVGYVDPKSDQKSGPGEVRRYARDSSGASVVEIHLKADKSAKISNALGSIELTPTGEIQIKSPLGTIDVLATGAITLSNALGSIALSAAGGITLTSPSGVVEVAVGGSVTVNGVIIDPSGNVTAPSGSTISAPTVKGTSSLEAAGKELVAHIHNGVTTGVGNTGPNQ